MDVRVLEGVLEWAAGRPVWQQQGIRHLLQESVDDEVIANLADLCVAEQRGDTLEHEVGPLPRPEEVESDGSGMSSVRLAAICNARDVNALATDQELTFSPNGLTIPKDPIT